MFYLVEKIKIKYSVLVLFFIFLIFGIFGKVAQASSMGNLPNPQEIVIRNEVNRNSLWGIMSILNAPIRFFRWLFGGSTATPIIEEKSNLEEEEEDKDI